MGGKSKSEILSLIVLKRCRPLAPKTNLNLKQNKTNTEIVY